MLDHEKEKPDEKSQGRLESMQSNFLESFRSLQQSGLYTLNNTNA